MEIYNLAATFTNAEYLIQHLPARGNENSQSNSMEPLLLKCVAITEAVASSGSEVLGYQAPSRATESDRIFIRSQGNSFPVI